MKFSRVLMLAVALLALGYVAASCGDDDNTQTDTPSESGADADAEVGADADADVAETTPDVEPDVVPDVVPDVAPDVTPDVTPDETPDTTTDVGALNTGDPCTSATECLGPGAQCLTEMTVPVAGTIEFPGGYCSSTCTPTGGECGPDGYCMDASIVGGPIGCVKRCTSATAEEDCRTEEGYQCSNFMIFAETFCAPPVSMGG